MYKHEIRKCPKTCMNPENTNICNEEPMEGCVCDQGYVLNGEDCIPEEDCGCAFTVDGDTIVMYEVGDTDICLYGCHGMTSGWA